MRVILLKPLKYTSGKIHPAGKNLDVRLDFGAELVYRKKIAGEIPEYIGGKFHIGGEPSNDMAELQRKPIDGKQKDITLEEYKKYIDGINRSRKRTSKD